MEALDKFNKMLGSIASQAGVVISSNAKVRSLFLKRAEHAAYEYIIEENEDHRPLAVQKEKLQIMLNLMETAFSRVEEGLYSKNVIKQGIDIFVEQMAVLWNRGDLAIGISASGNSPNVLKAIEYAKNHGGKTIGFSGFGGGKLAKMADLNITFSSRNYGVVEDMHLILTHLISQAFRQWLQE